jgi:hypothetical protein
MGFKLDEQNGVWIFGRESPGFKHPGISIDYKTYQKLKMAPDKIPEYFKRNDKGEIVAKPAIKDIP